MRGFIFSSKAPGVIVEDTIFSNACSKSGLDNSNDFRKGGDAQPPEYFQ